MSEPGRRWFQLHLSTAIVLMFLAGGILWMNISDYVAVVGVSHEPSGFRSEITAEVRGWPFYDTVMQPRARRSDLSSPLQIYHFNLRASASPYIAICLNLLFTFLILFGVARGIEKLMYGDKSSTEESR